MFWLLFGDGDGGGSGFDDCCVIAFASWLMVDRSDAVFRWAIARRSVVWCGVVRSGRCRDGTNLG